MTTPPRLTLRVRGELACFSRPEFKTERASYPWITPSAARAVFEAVLWKPAICWEVRRITLLRPIRFVSFRRNEIKTKIAPAKAKPGKAEHLTDKDRAQRNTVALRNVDYLIEAEMLLTEKGHSDGEKLQKCVAMFTRRLERGQQFTQPYLGCREFAACVMQPDGTERPIDTRFDHGLMFYDMKFAPAEKKKAKNIPYFVDAQLREGIVDVPPRAEIMGGAS